MENYIQGKKYVKVLQLIVKKKSSKGVNKAPTTYIYTKLYITKGIILKSKLRKIYFKEFKDRQKMSVNKSRFWTKCHFCKMEFMFPSICKNKRFNFPTCGQIFIMEECQGDVHMQIKILEYEVEQLEQQKKE